MVAVPDATPETIPVLPMVATDVFEDDHEPPVEVLDNVVVEPVHTDEEPVMVPASVPAL